MIAFLLVFDVVFLFPAVSTFGHFSSFADGPESLFDLVAAVFLGAWLLGWSLAPLAITAVIVVLLAGREVVRITPGRLELTIGIPFIGLTADYELDKLRNLRVEQPAGKSGKAWRGDHFAFDYGANSGSFGTNVGLQDRGEIESAIRVAGGDPARKGEATPEELEGEWESVPETANPVPLDEPPVVDAPSSNLSASVLALVVANLVPVAGTVFLGWKLSDVMVLYWAESAIIGLLNMVKIMVIGRAWAVFAALFFAGHFGAFMAVHFLFIYTLFIEGFQGSGPSGDLGRVAALFIGLWPALLALAVSHAYSFFVNFLGRREYRRRTVSKQMNEPYSRIVFMHLVLIFGGGLAMVLGGPVIVILIVIAVKIVLDVRSHLKQRAAAGGSSSAP